MRGRDRNQRRKEEGRRGEGEGIPFIVDLSSNDAVEESIIKFLIRKQDEIGKVIGNHKGAIGHSNFGSPSRKGNVETKKVP